ncbi:MAG: T9SS type A sorting domain-containing protein [Bacteroidia bacterium]
MRTIFILFFLSAAAAMNAQIQFVRFDSVPVTVNAQALNFPWAGGINFAQFSEIDLDQNGTMDLFVFDRTGDKITTYINNGTPNQVDYSIAPQYITRFPRLHDWAILRDYNCDGKMDIFTAYSGSSPGISVWENISTLVGGLQFQLVANPLMTDIAPNTNHTTSILWVTNVDIPAVRDIDNDGDLDVLTFDPSGVFVEFHRNYSKENHGNCNFLEFQLESQCWGEFSENTLNSNLNLNISCPPPPIANGNPLPDVLHSVHNGSCLECINTDNDNDMDILVGDLSSPYNTYGRNGGDSSHAAMDFVDNRYPNYDSTLTMNIWNCAFHLDVDNDGIKDLLFSPDAPNSSENYKSVWYYHNTGTNKDVQSQFIQNNFLQDNMIELGEGAFPRFFDYDSDGDDDLFIGNYGFYGSPTYASKIALYKNIGTTTTPAFRLQTDDFINLFATTSNIICPVPAFGDLDGDGDADMVIGNATGKLHFYRKDPGPADNFIFVSSNYMGIDVGSYSTPQLVDVDRDGKLDLLIGEASGNINYYRNTGTTTVPAFSLITPLFGNVIVNQVGYTTGYSVPYLWDNSGSYVLLSGSERGFIFRYDNIDGNLTGNFTLTDSLYVSSREGLRSAPWMGHLNSDTLPELIIGNYSGGVSLFFGDVIDGVDEFKGQAFDFGIYPNPAQQAFTLSNSLAQKELPATFSILNMEGQVIMEKQITSSNEQIDVSAFAAGIYICRLQGSSGIVSHQKLVLSK